MDHSIFCNTNPFIIKSHRKFIKNSWNYTSIPPIWFYGVVFN